MNEAYLNKFLLTDDLTTSDPYDIWKSGIGLRIKSLYYRNKVLAFVPASFMTLFDCFINNSLRVGYVKQEYPIVRALAALSLMSLYSKGRERSLLDQAKIHIDRLIELSSYGYSGFCCGMNAVWSSKNGLYPADMPYATNTPYALEALIKYRRVSGSNEFDSLIISVFNFLEKDLRIVFEDDEKLALSYAPVDEPRIVINSNSYSLYMYALLLEFLPHERNYISNKIDKIYNYIISFQAGEGSWNYYGDSHSGNFIDCFHSCFILKNIIKTDHLYSLTLSNEVVMKGYKFLLANIFEQSSGLFRRFARTDKPGLVKYDLYDNAEMLGLSVLLDDIKTAKPLAEQIHKYFIKGDNIYSTIDCFGFKRNKNMLRWATMPYLYALAEYSVYAKN